MKNLILKHQSNVDIMKLQDKNTLILRIYNDAKSTPPLLLLSYLLKRMIY